MWPLTALDRSRSAILALNAHVERAGCAWACAYSSSDEFEAAVLRSRRDAGGYGRMRLALHAGVATIVIVAVSLLKF
jgi:hypothetical protein